MVEVTDDPGGGAAPTQGGSGRPPSPYVESYNQQIAAKGQEIEETRRFEQYVHDNLGADQWGSSRVPALERERDGLAAQRQMFEDARTNANAVGAAQAGNLWPLAGRVAADPVLGTLAGAGIGKVLGGVVGAAGRGLGRLRGGAAAADAAAAKPATAPTPVEPCPDQAAPQPIANSPALAGNYTATVSREGLQAVKEHLAQFGPHAPNDAMVTRLQTALDSGRPVTGGDANFYLHELSEADLMKDGLSYDEAHAAALKKYGVSLYSVYSPDVIQQHPDHYNNN